MPIFGKRINVIAATKFNLPRIRCVADRCFTNYRDCRCHCDDDLGCTHKIDNCYIYPECIRDWLTHEEFMNVQLIDIIIMPNDIRQPYFLRLKRILYDIQAVVIKQFHNIHLYLA